MESKLTHKLPSAYKGTVQAVMSAGLGTPHADPRLEVVYQEGYAPEGLDVVSNSGIAVGINKDGYTEPAGIKLNGEKIAPYGIIADALLGMACAYDDAVPGEWEVLPTEFNGAMTMTESLHQRIPTVYQAATLFEVGRAYKKTGALAELFDVKLGDLLRPITEAELDAALADGTLPAVRVGEHKQAKSGSKKKADVLKGEALKAFYKGTLVKFGVEIEGVTPEGANGIEMKCARVAAKVHPGVYENFAYTNQWVFDYDVQGPGTEGHSRNVWNSISETRREAEYKVEILQFYVTM